MNVRKQSGASKAIRKEVGVDAKSYCLIDGEKVYSGPEFERAKRKWGQSKGPIEVIDSEHARGVDESKL